MNRFHILTMILVTILMLAPDAVFPVDSIKRESMNHLLKFCDRLLDDQIAAPADSNFGAIRNPESVTISKASEEAVFPLAIAFKITGQKKYGVGALRSANRSLRFFLDNGVWPDNPTTAALHHLLGVALAYPVLVKHFPGEIQNAWLKLFLIASENLKEDLELNVAKHSSTQLALTAATLAALHKIQPNHHLRASAEKAAFNFLERMTTDGFIAEYDFLAEDDLPAIAPGTTLETSLPALAVFSSLLDQERFSSDFTNALADYLYLVYPDGMLDNAWGANSANWHPAGNFDTWGSQAAFCLFAESDPRFYAAARRNLNLLTENPSLQGETNLPVIRRAFGLALTLTLENNPPAENKVLPADIVGWYKQFDSQNLVVIRTRNYMVTISGYRTGNRSGGGMISTFWDKDAGLLQTTTPNQYIRKNDNFPELSYSPLPLTARIECEQDGQLFRNLYDLNCRLKSRQKGWDKFQVVTAGELKSDSQKSAGIKYLVNYYFSGNQIKKDIRLSYFGKKTEVQVVEPFLVGPETKISKKDASRVVIKHPRAIWYLQIEAGEGEIELGVETDRYRWPVSALQSMPVTIKLLKRKKGQQNRLVYSLKKVSVLGETLADFRIE